MALDPGRWPPAHLLRMAFDRCRTYDEAVALLTEAPVARPALFSIVGAERGQGCLIERTETAPCIHPGPCCVANDCHPAGPALPGTWIPHGTFVRGLADSENRRTALERHNCEGRFAWLVDPVLNGLTRLAVETSPATGELRVLGFEPTTKWMSDVAPATAMFEAEIGRDAGAQTAARIAAQ